MKYRVDYKIVGRVIECYSLKGSIIMCSLFDDTPFEEMVYIKPFLVDENGNISNEDGMFLNKKKVDFQSFVINFNLKKDFVIQEREEEESIFDIFDEKGNIIAEDLVSRRLFPLVSLETGKITDKF